MRKIITLSLLISLGLMAVLLVFAQVPVPQEIKECRMRKNLTGADWQNAGFYCPGVNSTCNFENPPTVGGRPATCAICCIMDTIYTIADWVFYIVLAVAIIFVIYGAYLIMTAGGAPDKIKNGRDFILWSIVGLIVGLLAKSIPSIARTIIGA